LFMDICSGLCGLVDGKREKSRDSVGEGGG